MCKKLIHIYIPVILCCAAMAFVDSIWQPGYALKSAVKILLFLALPVLILHLQKDGGFFFLKPDRKSFLTGAILGTVTLGVILLGYQLLKPYLDLSAIPDALSKDAGINAENFVYVSIYISLCNSFLEEFLFRGFAFLYPRRNGKSGLFNTLSALCFAVYHCAILDGWFSPALYGIILIALFGCGLLFNFLDRYRERIWASWLVHLFANIGINLIGMELLGIL